MSTAATPLIAHVRAGGLERRRFALAVALGFLAVASAGALLMTSGYLISRAAQRPEILSLTVAIVAVRAFAIVRALARYGERLASHDAALRMMGRLRARFFALLAPLVPGALAGVSARGGDILTRFVADVDALQDLYVRGLAPPLVAGLVTIAAAAAAWLLLPAAGAVMLLALLLAATLTPALTALLATRSGRRQAPARALLSSELVEAIDGSVELALAGRAPERLRRIETADARLAALGRNDGVAAGAATTLSALASGLTVVALLVVALPAVHDGRLAGVLLAALAFLALAAFEGLAPLSLAARRLGACAESARRLDELCGCEPPVREAEHPLALPAGGDLEVEDVHLRYGPGQPWVLRGASLRLRPGSRIAIRGPSGAGKSTLAELLVRFRDPDAGRVLLGGVDLRLLATEDVRSAVVLAAQDAHIFNTTIRENVLLARRDAGEEELLAALAAAGLGEWLASLPEGLETHVGEDGALVSGGERQRIALARAFLARARFLVLDEPTAHLDAETARAVLRDAVTGAGASGVLVITHSDVGLELFDEVLELRDGLLRRPPDLPRTCSAESPDARVAALA